jgi:hypothetical protein
VLNDTFTSSLINIDVVRSFVLLSSLLTIAGALTLIPSITRRSVQGALVRFYRIGDEYHRGVDIAINESNFKSWEAFLNYLNRQSKLASSKGAIKHVYSLIGEEIFSINQFKHRHSYVVSYGSFVRTHFRHTNDSFTDDVFIYAQQDMMTYWNNRASIFSRYQPVSQFPMEKIYFVPYSRLTSHESLLFNRHAMSVFDDWLHNQVTDLLSRYINDEYITNVFAVTELMFVEVKSFSKLFHMLTLTDTYIACTHDDYAHARNYLASIKPKDLFIDNVGIRHANNRTYRPTQTRPHMEDAQVNLKWM